LKNTVIASILILISSISHAKSSQAFKELENLTASCSELMGIYQSREKQELLAAQTTSLSEALRAGYCKGVVEQYARENYCYKSSWFEMAKFIAVQRGYEENFRKLNTILKMACND